MKFNTPTKLSVGVIGLILLAVLSACWAVELIMPDSAYKGDAIVGRVMPRVTIFVGGKICHVSPKGYFVIGVPQRPS